MTESHPEQGATSAGRRIAKVLGLLVLAVVILYVLFSFVFPWVERNISNPSLDAAPAHHLGAHA